MIKNEKQYQTARKQLYHFQKALTASKKTAGKMEPVIFEAMLEGIRSQVTELEEEIAAYERLKNQQEEIVMRDLSELPQILIKVRIMKGMTQEQLAKRLHLRQQQIQQYEEKDYKGIGFSNLLKISRALGISLGNKIKIKA